MSSKTKQRALDTPTIKYEAILWNFILGSILGFIIEGVWDVIYSGRWVSNSALVWGPFCVIYGVGACCAYIASCLLYNQTMPVQFIVCALSGGAVEYFGSLFQELVLGSRSWNYSDHFLNINGRISLQMIFLWGILGVAYIKLLFPLMRRIAGRLKILSSRALSVGLSALMVANILVSSAALLRWKDRQHDVPSNGKVEAWLDEHYSDQVMNSIYSNMTFQ